MPFLLQPIVLSTLHYLDPGSGSYIFQILIATLVGAAFLVKVFWQRIKAFFVRLFGRGDKGEN